MERGHQRQIADPFRLHEGHVRRIPGRYFDKSLFHHSSFGAQVLETQWSRRELDTPPGWSFSATASPLKSLTTSAAKPLRKLDTFTHLLDWKGGSFKRNPLEVDMACFVNGG